MKKYTLDRLFLIVLLLSIGIASVSCGSDDPDPVVIVDPVVDPTNANTTIEATSPAIADGTETSTVTVTLADTNGSAFTSSGGTVVLVSTGDAVISSVTDNGNGTYSATVTNTTAETVTISGTLAGTAITDTAEIIFEPIPDATESTEPVGPTLIKINCGGDEITIGSDTFLADQFFDGPTNIFVNEFLTEVADTELDELFLTERVTTFPMSTSPFSYKIPVSNGTYTVKLYWAEVYWGVHPDGINGGVGSRVFSVTMEDMPIVTDIDLFEELGAATADTRMYDIEVTDGELTIVFQSTVDRPKISAIEIFGNGAINP